MTELAWSVFEAVNPLYAAHLACYDVANDTSLQRVATALGEENLYDARGSEPRFLHSQEGALIEAREWMIDALRSLDARTDTLVLYGIGAGWYWKALLPWLERRKERRVFVLEDDLHIIAHFLDSEVGQEFFAHPQSRLIAIAGPEDKATFDCICWNLFKKHYCFLAIPPYATWRQNATKILENSLHVRATDIHLVAAEFLTFGVQHARNFLRNVTLFEKALNAQDLFGRCKNIPVVVVAAGPSLHEALPLLRKWQEKNEALILAGGSSVNALLEEGIIPHAACTVDPNPLQYSRMKYLEPFQMPLFFRGRALYEGVCAADGHPLLYLRGSDGYPFVTYMEEALGVEGDILDGGDSVATLLIELAVALGASDIIMVGYDLSYVDDKRYSPSLEKVLHGSEEGVLRKKVEEQKAEYRTRGRAYSGQEIYTEAKWIVERDWIDRFVASLPDDIRIYNTTPKGLVISSVPYKSLQEIDTYLIDKKLRNFPRDVTAQFLSLVYDCRPLGPLASSEAISKALQHISESLEKCRLTASSLLSCSQKMETSEEALLTHDFEYSFAFPHLLLPFWRMHEVWSSMQLHLETPYSQSDWREERAQMERQQYTSRVQFMLETIDAYQKLFFSFASWAFLQGVFLPEPYDAAPWPDGVRKAEEFQIEEKRERAHR